MSAAEHLGDSRYEASREARRADRAESALESARADLEAVTRERDLAVAQGDELGNRHSALHAATTELQRRLALALARLDETETLLNEKSSWQERASQVMKNNELRALCAEPLPTEKKQR